MPVTPDPERAERAALDVARLVANLHPLLAPAGPAGLDRAVLGVVLADPGEDLVASEGDVVLGVGVRDDAQVAELVRRAADARCAAVVVKATAPDAAAGVPVLRLTDGAVWLHVAELVRSALAAVDPLGGGISTGGGGLFELAEAIAAVVGGPVTIEDTASRVLAFSGRQEESDEGRIATVLGRRVPQHYLDALEAQGVFRSLRESDEPVFVESFEDNLLPRVAVAVRAGDEVLGSIWAAVPVRPDARQSAALRDSARVVALHLLRQRVGADVTRTLQADLLSVALTGGARAAESAERLQLRGPVRLVALRFHGIGPDVDAGASLVPLRDEVAFHFGVVHPHVASVVIGGVVYIVVPEPHRDGRVRRAAQSLLDRTPAARDLVVAVGDPVDGAARLPAARAEADRVVRALGLLRTRTGRRLAAPADVRVETLLLRISDAMATDGALDDTPLRVLHTYDDEHGTDLVATLSVFLAEMGNVRAAAEALNVHQNTLRYRIARVRAVGGLDLDDPDVRFTAQLLLRLENLRE